MQFSVYWTEWKAKLWDCYRQCVIDRFLPSVRRQVRRPRCTFCLSEALSRFWCVPSKLSIFFYWRAKVCAGEKVRHKVISTWGGKIDWRTCCTRFASFAALCVLTNEFWLVLPLHFLLFSLIVFNFDTRVVKVNCGNFLWSIVSN